MKITNIRIFMMHRYYCKSGCYCPIEHPSIKESNVAMRNIVVMSPQYVLIPKNCNTLNLYNINLH